jgi:uncharacterized repeat protein (TIGR02543 family)
VVYVRDKGGRVDWLPKARCHGYDFLGWYTERIGGTPVIKSMLIETNTTVYAHYEGLYDNRIFVTGERAASYSPNKTSGGFYETGYVSSGTVGVGMQNSKREDGFIQVSFGDRVEWIKTNSLLKGELKTVLKTGGGVDMNVRKTSSGKGKKLREVKPYEVFVVVGEYDGWYRVACPEGEKGFAYVSSALFG